MSYLQLAVKTLIIIVATILGLRIFAVLLQRVPGLFVSLSVIAIGILLFALYKGSFRAVGLKHRKSILIAIAGFVFLFFISGSIMLFVER